MEKINKGDPYSCFLELVWIQRVEIFKELLGLYCTG